MILSNPVMMLSIVCCSGQFTVFPVPKELSVVTQAKILSLRRRFWISYLPMRVTTMKLCPQVDIK